MMADPHYHRSSLDAIKKKGAEWGALTGAEEKFLISFDREDCAANTGRGHTCPQPK